MLTGRQGQAQVRVCVRAHSCVPARARARACVCFGMCVCASVSVCVFVRLEVCSRARELNWFMMALVYHIDDSLSVRPCKIVCARVCILLFSQVPIRRKLLFFLIIL